MTDDKIATLARQTLERGEGILRLSPCWVPRSFLQPGRRLKLAGEDLYALGAHRGGIDERWLSSCVPADNPGAPPDEGLTYVLVDESLLFGSRPNRSAGRSGRANRLVHVADLERITLRDAVAAMGADLIGPAIWDRYRRWPVFAKFFDNMGPIPHHLHQDDDLAALVGREGKPEAYYFPPQLNASPNRFPYTFMGLEPGTTREDVRRCLERWNAGDNGILDLSRAYRLLPGAGWLIGPRILHAPGTLCTFEPQWASDVFAMFQNFVEDRFVPWDLLVKDLPADRRNDLDFILDLIDWDANLDPAFRRNHYLEPVVATGGPEAGFVDRWVVYGRIHGRQLFTARELTVLPGAHVVIADPGCYGLICVQGHGTIGPPGADEPRFFIESPALIRFGQMTSDEFFVAAPRAREGVQFSNNSETEPLVTLRYFGPEADPGAPDLR